MSTDTIERQQAALDEHHDDPGNLPVMRARFEHNGSPRYMLYTIKRLGLDREHGFHLDVQLVSDELEGGMETVEARLQDGEADLIDIDSSRRPASARRGPPSSPSTPTAGPSAASSRPTTPTSKG